MLIKHRSCLILYFVTYPFGDQRKRWNSSYAKALGSLYMIIKPSNSDVQYCGSRWGGVCQWHRTANCCTGYVNESSYLEITSLSKVWTQTVAVIDISWDTLENIVFLNNVCMWTSVVTHFGLYIFIESIRKNGIHFPLLVATAVTCLHPHLFVASPMNCYNNWIWCLG